MAFIQTGVGPKGAILGYNRTSKDQYPTNKKAKVSLKGKLKIKKGK